MNKVFIIAEAGVNHNGDIDLAIQLIDEAVKAGVDAVKFQTFIPENVISKNAKKADYQLNTTSNNESQLDMVKKLYLSESNFVILKKHCDLKKIEFISSPFDMDSIDTIMRLGVDRIKIPSGEITNLPYLRKIGALNIPVILSTGMANINEIEESIKVLTSSGTNIDKISLLHCNTEYPTPPEDANLRAIKTIEFQFGLNTGYSDHTQGIHFPIAAVALGATIIEKHFTLDKKMDGPDHIASLDPTELINMVNAIRDIEVGLGNGIKIPSASESKNIEIARKSITAKINIKSGDIFTESNITTKRPGNGISPMNWDDYIGKKAHRDYIEDELIDD